MIATSVLSRGLDVKGLQLVVNYACPDHLEDYIHRIGRTGRAGNKGTAYTFITADEDQHAYYLVKALYSSNQDIPEELQKLNTKFKQKVKNGDAVIYTDVNIKMRGFKFNEQE